MANDELGETLPASQAPAPTSSDRLVRGQTIGRYVVLGTLGSGGMGIVYAAHDPELDRRVAVKLLRARDADPDARARIRREAQALARSQHPNVVAVYDVGDHGDGLYIAMELVEGGTLRQWQAKHPWKATLAAYVAAGRGLAAAHARGLVHRDFKPENVLVGADDHARVTDFGLARLDGDDDAEGVVMGTLGYMPPEQCDGAAVDARSDQFAWCVSLWEALYGARPFRATTVEAIAAEMRAAPPAIPARPEIPAAIGLALRRGLAADRDARWPAMEPLLDAIAPARRIGRRRTIAIVALVAICLALGAAFVVSGATRGAGGTAEPACASSASRLAGVWDPPRRTALALRFQTVVGTGARDRPDLAGVLALATRDFDTYASTWAAAWDTACTSDERRADPLLHAQRINCLERSLVDLQGITSAFLAGAPSSIAASWPGNAFTRWSTPLADCANVDAIRATPPAPLPANRAEVAQLVVDLHATREEARDAINEHVASNTVAPLARLDAIVTRLDQLGAPAAAEAAWWRAEYLGGRGDRAARRDALDRAIALARKYRNDRWLAFAYALQIESALDAHDTARARALADEMDRAYERAGGDPKHLEARAAIAVDAGNYAEALATIRATRHAGDALDHIGPDRGAAVAVRILVAAGRTDEAIAEARRHVAYLAELWHGDHWQVADAHELLAHALMYARDFAGARIEVRAALAMHARIDSNPDRVHSAQLLALACAALAGDDADRDALAAAITASGGRPYESAIDLATEWAPSLLPWAIAHTTPSADLDDEASDAAFLGGDLATAERLARRTPLVTDTLAHAGERFVVLAMIEARRHAPASVLAPYLAALARFRASPDAATHAIATEILAMVDGARGDWPAVRALLEAEPLPIFKPMTTQRAVVDGLLGRALVETGDAARGIPLLERCLFTAVNVDYTFASSNYLIADARAALARAVPR